MKNQKHILALSTAVALAFLAGCDSGSKSEPKIDTTAKEAGQKTEGVASEVGKAVEGAKATGEKVVTEVKAAGEKAVTDAKAAANTAATDASSKVTAIIDQAKALIGQNKYSDALTALGNLSGLKLTPEQEKLVASLKEQINKAMASDGAKAVGNLIK